MKKSYIALAVLALAALASCQENELRNDTYTPQEGEILFKIANNSKQTKASDVEAAVEKSEPIYLGTSEGHEFYLEETVINLDDMAYSPATKGTPGYTENFHELYGGFNAAAYQVGASDAYEEDGRFEVANETKLIYKRKYGNDLWDASKGIYFFLRAGEQTGTLAGVSGLPGGYNSTDGSISFSYNGSSMTKAADMKDILFTSRKVLSEDEYNQLISKDEGVPILFHHVLTGVKFAIGNASSEDTKIQINSVTFTGLYDQGSCVLKPVTENGGYKDIATNYSSAAKYDDNGNHISGAAWDFTGKTPSTTPYTSDTFDEIVTYSEGGSFKDGNTNKGKYPKSFSDAGNERNLNDKLATQTFWFIPQAMARTGSAAHVIATINVTDETGTYDWPIDFTSVLNSVEWKAGELRTYTIKVDEVNVTITDSFTSSEKSSVTITNTGNTSVFIRAAIIGQWVDSANQPVFGYTDYRDGLPHAEEIPSWYQDYITGTGYFGKFIGLAGYAAGEGNANADGDNPYNGWFFNSADGYYYYTTPVASKASPNPLFSKYIIDSDHIPPMLVGGILVPTTLLMDISTQAISAKDIDGSDAYKKEDGTYDYLAAWANAKSIATDAPAVTPSN